LANRDPVVQSTRLVKLLSAEAPATIIDLYEQAIQRASVLFQDWTRRPEPKALFDAHFVPVTGGDPREYDPSAPPLLKHRPEPVDLSYETWLRGWCFHQVLVGNDPPPLNYHFLAHPDRPAIFDFFEGMVGKGLMGDFQEAYERSAEALWPLAPREQDREFLSYLEQDEHAPYRVQLYRATAREVARDMNASPSWRQWWLSGPLRRLEFAIVESHQMRKKTEGTTTRIRKRGLTVIGDVIPNIDRILETEEADIRQLVVEDLRVLLLKIHKKYGFTRELPTAE
jgi:hypothetical protein